MRCWRARNVSDPICDDCAGFDIECMHHCEKRRGKVFEMLPPANVVPLRAADQYFTWIEERT